MLKFKIETNRRSDLGYPEITQRKSQDKNMDRARPAVVCRNAKAVHEHRRTLASYSVPMNKLSGQAVLESKHQTEISLSREFLLFLYRCVRLQCSSLIDVANRFSTYNNKNYLLTLRFKCIRLSLTPSSSPRTTS